MIGAGLLASTVIAFGPLKHEQRPAPLASHYKEYKSISELQADSKLKVILRQVSPPRKRRIRDFDYPIADFEIVSKPRKGEIIPIMLPSTLYEDPVGWNGKKDTKLIAFLDQFTFGDDEQFAEYVFVGDGAGIFVTNDPKRDYTKFGKENESLPTTVNPSQLQLEE